MVLVRFFLIIFALSVGVLHGALQDDLARLADSLNALAGVLQPRSQAPVVQPNNNPVVPQPNPVGSLYPTFAAWKAACAKLPLYKDSKGQQPADKADKFTYQELESCMQAYMQRLNSTPDSMWLNPGNLNRTFSLSTLTFVPYVQKVIVPAGSEILFHGDWHGDVQSLLALITYLQDNGYMDKSDGFKITKPNFYIVFLGDYVDRGHHSVEVLYTLLRLKLANFDRVFLNRGNHEHEDQTSDYGFADEWLVKKFNSQDEHTVSNFFELLPVATYVGSGDATQMNYLLTCHGGIEPGYNPQQFLASTAQYERIGSLPRYTIFKKIFDDKRYNFVRQEINYLIQARYPSESTPGKFYEYRSTEDITPEKLDDANKLGFLWSDFQIDNSLETGLDARDNEHALTLSSNLTKALLDYQSTPKYTMRGIFRAHQHNGEMMVLMTQGGKSQPAQLWQKPAGWETKNVWPGMVFTFNVAPNTSYGMTKGFTNDSCGLLTTAIKFDDWKFKVISLDSQGRVSN